MFSEVLGYISALAFRFNVRLEVFLFLYVFASILCIWVVAIALRRIKKKEPVWPLVYGFSFSWVLPYVYVLVFGQNIPAWAVVLIVILAAIGFRVAQERFREFRERRKQS